MKAMILAAGLGTRLEPLTRIKPKPLVPVGNRPIIDHTILWLKTHGVTEIIVNAHHHRDQIISYLNGGGSFGMPITVSQETEILGTGGGIRKTMGFWGEDPFIVVNGDILTDVDLTRAFEVHRQRDDLVTLVLHDFKPFNQIRLNAHDNILDIQPKPDKGRLAFTGIHIIHPSVLQHIPEKRFSCILETYRALISTEKPVRGHVVKNHYWRDAGTLESYVKANREILKTSPFLVGRNCSIHPDARLKDWAVLGDETVLEKGAQVVRSILWGNIRVRENVRIADSIVIRPGEVCHSIENAVF